MTVRHPFGFVEPCLPSKAEQPPSGPLWVHEIKHDGSRLMVRRDGSRIVRCFTRNGNDWSDRFPAIVETATQLRATSFLIEGEAVNIGDDGTPDFRALGSRSREAMLVAFDFIAHNGNDLRDLPLLKRKQRLARLIGNPRTWRAIQYCDHLTGDGATVFKQVCRMGLEGIVSKRIDAPYRSGPSKTWLKSMNPASEAVRREREEDWR